MGQRVALCIDELTCRNPSLVGLDGESLENQNWLDVFAKGQEARGAVGCGDDFAEAWIVSCDDVDPINLAATLKQDKPELIVRLVVAESCGSLFSRAHTASIDEVLEESAFLRRYAETKARLGRQDDAIVIEPTQGTLGRHAELAIVEPEVQAVSTQALAPTVLQRRSIAVAVRQPGFIMPIVSGSGGAGKSAVSAIASLVSAEMGYKTLLVDYDLQFGDMAVLMGAGEALAIDEAIAHPERLEQEIANRAPVTLLAAPDRLEKAEEVVRQMPAFLDDVVGSFDVVIANTGAAWAEQHAVLLERSYVSLFLIDQRASSIRACKHALELCARCGIASGPFEYALNRCAKGAPLTTADVSCALQVESVFELKEGGRDVEDYLGSGSGQELLRSGNEFCESVRQVMGRLLPQGAPAGFADGGGDRERKISRRRGRHIGRKRGRKS